jgi:Kef-type K+ transport system membrane component KefB
VILSRNKLKQIGVDVLGVFLIVGAGLTSWLPGPGGIPLLILGLSLLATNHEWAARWLKTVQRHGVNISNKLFSNNPWVRWGIDIASVALIAVAVIVLSQVTRSRTKTAAISLILVAIFLMLGNRERIKTLRKNIFKR